MAQVDAPVNFPAHRLNWDRISAALVAAPGRPLEDPHRTRAAVAMILRDRDGVPELLFIERSRHDGDPWSGDIGFPGGKLDPGDVGPEQAARRETAEETGIDLSRAALLGRLDDIAGAWLPVVVSCFVFRLDTPAALELSGEVERTFWLPLATVLDPARRTEARVRFQGQDLVRPAVRLPVAGHNILWGISYRLLEALRRRLAPS